MFCNIQAIVSRPYVSATETVKAWNRDNSAQFCWLLLAMIRLCVQRRPSDTQDAVKMTPERGICLCVRQLVQKRGVASYDCAFTGAWVASFAMEMPQLDHGRVVPEPYGKIMSMPEPTSGLRTQRELIAETVN